MPFKDPEMKREQMKRWNDEQIRLGYGKWLYARRKLRYQAAERYREALEMIVSQEVETVEAAKLTASRAMREIDNEDQKLGNWPYRRAKRRVEEGKAT